MRKIIEQATLPAPTGVMPGEPPPSQQAPGIVDEGEDVQATPEEQADYEQFVLKAIQFIHGPKSSRAVLQHLNQKDTSVPEAVGRTTAFIVKNISNSAKLAKASVSPDVMFEASHEIVEELLGVGSASGIFPIKWPEQDNAPLSPEQEDLAAQSVSLAAHFYGQEFVKTREAQDLKPQAQDMVLAGIAREADRGQLDPDFAQSQGRATTVRDGVQRALIKRVQ